MRPGVQAADVVVGTGDEAVRGKVAVVTVCISLLDGTDLSASLQLPGRQLVDLGRRDCIAGLRYGIEGMRVGGRRELTIAPHLAYGDKGIPDRVPPNATLRCQVELLEVRERGVMKPEDYPQGRQLVIGWLGDLQHGMAKWQFGLHDDGRCGAMIQVPIPGLKWRHSRPKIVETKLDPTRAASLIDSAATLQRTHSEDCLPDDRVYVDHAGHDGGVHRSRKTDELCLALTLWERGQHVSFFLTASSKAWQASDLRALVCEVIAPVLEASQKAGEPIGQIP